MSYELLQTQKNQIFDLIKKASLDPSDFEWKSVRTRGIQKERAVSLLSYKHTRYYFLFDVGSKSEHWIEYSPSQNVAVRPLGHVTSWGILLSHVQDWTNRLKAEIDAPDLWTILAQERKLIDTTSHLGTDNSQFTAEEQVRVAVSLNEIKQYLFKIENLSQAHKELLESQYEYLKDASTRMGRKDFLNILIGVLVTQVLTCGIITEKANALLGFAGQIFQWLVGAVNSLSFHT